LESYPEETDDSSKLRNRIVLVPKSVNNINLYTGSSRNNASEKPDSSIFDESEQSIVSRMSSNKQK
jgi:hypothetical protein